ncbi:Ldh family oxidoreductase [Candidatus Poribacteria bacterium]
MARDEIRVDWEELKAFTQEVFVKADIPPEDAEIVADVLVWANLRGIDSHGVLRIPWYTNMVDNGQINPKPDIKVLKETPAVLFIDSDRSFGPVITTSVMNRMMEKAKQVGIGWALIRDLTHQGALGYYSLMAAKEGMAGIALVCNPPNMAPYGAKTRGVHNSPISIAVPAKRHRPLVLDMATSVAAGGKLNLAVDKGIPIPEGWAIDADGKPTTDPNLARVLLPAGGPKGSGLALMFECLSSIMANNPLLEPILTDSPRERPLNQNSVVAAIDIGMFTDVETYKEHIDTTIDCLKALPKADGVDEIFVPGEPEDRCSDERIQNGIPLPEGTISNLQGVAERLGIEFPFS